MEPIVKTVDEYVAEVANRFGELSGEEAQGLLDLYGTPQLVTISRILGPEVSSVLGEAMNEISTSMSNTPQAIPAQPITPPVQETTMPMNKGGFLLKTAEQPKPQPKRNRGIAARKKK